jgi:lactate racemase
MRILLAFGKTGLEFELPDNLDVTVVEPAYVAGVPDPAVALQAALRAPINSPPLGECVRPGQTVGIIFSDITRPAPNALMLPILLAELAHIPRDDITLFNALGTHRANTDAELRDMLGEDIVDGYRIVQNESFDSSTQVHLGRSSLGHEIWINRELAECDVKILTGFIEPHLFAGFSGGGKAIMPGMAGLETILGNHDAKMVSHPKAIWGVTDGNPLLDEIREVAHLVGPDFLLNVSMNKEKQVTGVFAGELDAAHAQGCDFVRRTAMAPVDEPFDIVITSNSGYPLDLNLYQAIKGVSAAAQIVKPGGAIIVAADCWDGIPDHGLYKQLLQEATSPDALLETIHAPGFRKHDQWQAQVQAQIQCKADVYVYSHNLTETQIREVLLRPCSSIPDTVTSLVERHDAGARICVLPEGPQTVPFVSV